MSTSSACVEKRSRSPPSSKQPGASSGTVMLVAFPGQTPDSPSASHRCSHDNQGITISVPDGLAFGVWEVAPISDYGFALRVLSKQWQGEFCRCSINVVGGKQRDGGVDHLERFRHHTGPSPKAGKPMTQPTVDPLHCHRFILADVVPPNRQEGGVRRIIACTVQRDAPGF